MTVSGSTTQGGILLDVDYVVTPDQKAHTVLYLRSDGKRTRQIVDDFLPYFYVDCTEEQLQSIMADDQVLAEWFLYSEPTKRILYEGGQLQPLQKIYGKQPWKVPQIRARFASRQIAFYEADIPFTHRFMIDHQIKGLEHLDLTTMDSTQTTWSPRVCSLDIEINNDLQDTFEELVEQAAYRVTAIGMSWIADGKLSSKAFILEEDNDQAEINLLQSIFDFLWQEVDPDIIVTYNGDIFDFPYLVKRLEVQGIDTRILSPYGDTIPQPPQFGNGWKIPGVLIFDLYKRTRWMYTDDGRKTLDSVALKLLGEQKIELDISHGELWQQSLTNSERMKTFREYVIRDARLTVQLWEAMDMPQWLEVIKICGGPPGDAMYFTERQAGEFLVFQVMFREGILIPRAPTAAEKKLRKKERISAMGGFVFDPIRDIASSVLLCDFASMYPTIIVGHNIGGESFRGAVGTLKDRFNSEPRTSMAMMQEELLASRFEVKEQLEGAITDDDKKRLKAYSWAIKIVANSTFGAYNFIGSRFYDTDLAGTITGLGREYLQTIGMRVEEFADGYKTIYGDTDSVFIETPLNEKIQQLWEKDDDSITHIPEIGQLLGYLHEGLPPEMKLELEDIAYRIIFHKGAKKRYAYVSALDKQVYIKGFEAIRNDFSPFAREIQEFAFERLLRSGDVASTKKEVIELIKKMLERSEDQIKREVSTYGPIRRNPAKYKSMTPAVSAFLHLNSHNDGRLNWRDYDFFPFIIIKGTSSQKNRARHPDLVSFDEIDLDHYIEEGLRSIGRFNLPISLDEAKGIEYRDIVSYFEE